MTYHVYIIYSELKHKYYIGQTNDLVLRLAKHKSGLVKSTKHGIPWKLIWTTSVDSRSESMILEKKIKNIGSTRFLKKHL
ncbi:MAG: GIY-YIG nuclease family protein [Salibacteraceae bacterium]